MHSFLQIILCFVTASCIRVKPLGSVGWNSSFLLFQDRRHLNRESLQISLPREAFLKRYFKECCLWLDKEVLEEATQVLSEGGTLHPTILNALLGNTLGGSLFLAEAHKA